MTMLAPPSNVVARSVPVVATTPPAPMTLGLRARAFLFAWSTYLLLHHAMVYWAWFRFRDNQDRLALTELAVGLTLAVVAAVTVLRAGSLRWFTALLVCHLVYELPAVPKTANHTLLTVFMNVTMLAVIIGHAIRARGLRDADVVAFFPRMAALLRLEVLVMYFFVVLHKLNTDYFNPAYSCATELYAQIARMYPIFPTGAWTDPLCIYGAIGAEAAIPLLLLFRRTRVLGVGLGLVFHLMLSPHANSFIYSFSALLYAAYFLFLPTDVLREMVAVWSRLLSGVRRRWLWFVLAGAAAATIVVGLRLVAPTFVRETKLIDHAHVFLAAGIRFAWNLLAITNIVVFAIAVSRRRAAAGQTPASAPAAGVTAARAGHAEPFFRPALTPLIVLPLLVTLNGFCPYLGLKTEASFAMYANIRTEGQGNNHLFMPRINVLGNYQDDIVEIVASSDRSLRNLQRDGYAMTYFEFRRRLSRQRNEKFWVTFRRNGVERTLRRATDKDDPTFQPHSWIALKLLTFRNVQVGVTPQRCSH